MGRPGKGPRLVAAAVVLLVTLAAGTAGWAYLALTQPYIGWDGDRVDVVLEPGLHAGSMLGRLAEAGVLLHPELARAWVYWRGAGSRLHAGEYRFDEPVSALEVVLRLEQGRVLQHRITLAEGLTLQEVARRFAEAGLASREAMLEAFADPAPVRAFDAQASDLEGYLFPETYFFSGARPPREMAETLVRRFVEVTDEWLEQRSEAAGLTLREAVTLASLIERETGVAAERQRISRVFHNRLERGMRLECDPTVLYALERAGQPVVKLYRKHLLFDSPWNTYRVAGLPPGPIASPGRASLEAAVAPAAGNELYFVAAPDGGHRFSTTLEAHTRAVAEWRRYKAAHP